MRFQAGPEKSLQQHAVEPGDASLWLIVALSFVLFKLLGEGGTASASQPFLVQQSH